MSEFEAEIAAAMANPGLYGVPNMQGTNAVSSHREYRVAPAGDESPTSGSALGEVLAAADGPERPNAPASAALPTAPNPIDVSTMGGSPRQWWVRPEDAASMQESADYVNGDGPPPAGDGWQPFPPGPEGMKPL